MIKKKILIATGGTGGHVYPAYSLANYFKKKNFLVELTSDKRGLQYLKNYTNFNFTEIPASPLLKKNILQLIFSSLTVIISIIKSLVFLTFNRPSVVFGMGGYSSFPICIAASFLKIKFVIYESNLVLGKANKYLLPFAQKIFVSYKELEGVPEKFSDKICEIGNIIRDEIINFNFKSYDSKQFNSIQVLVLGGSQAAKAFADVLPNIFKQLKNSEFPLKVYQQCQKQQSEQLIEFYKKTQIDHEIFNFTDNITKYYSKANIVITRSGASVLGELINVKIPFISIPLPTSAENHQHKNAEFYVKKGFGYLLKEKDIKNKLYELIYSIFKDKSLIEKILLNQKTYSDKEIFKNLNKEIEEILNEKN